MHIFSMEYMVDESTSTGNACLLYKTQEIDGNFLSSGP